MAIYRLGSEGNYYYAVQSGKEKYPLCFATVSDANAFAAWRSIVWQATYRLPTEEEWEKAAAWDPVEQNYYLYGFHRNTIDCPWANYNNCFVELLPVGSFNGTSGKNNAKSFYGCYDMSGNLWEWTSGIEGEDSVVRGGTWDSPAEECTTLSRQSAPPEERYDVVGFRLVRELD
jgi:formylglycine-generating enzyme required for sulfatase activity